MTAPEETKNRKLAVWMITALFVLFGLVFFVYWIIWGQFREITDDAYVNGNLIMLTPQENGIIVSILADNAQMVEEGQPLVQLDRHDFEISLAKAEADLGVAIRRITREFWNVEQLEAKRKVREADLLKAHLDYDHRAALVADASVSREDFEHSETALMGALSSLLEVDKELAGAKALVDNTTITAHPEVEQAKASLRSAFLALHRCQVLAPVRGIVTQRKAQVGQWVKANDPLMSLVAIDQIWVDANFREGELRNIRIGQPVELFADMYGRRKKFHGTVFGLNPGTGSVFSILPPQNATGNWIKIVQRIPVKIALNPDEIKKRPLLLGLSITAKVDTHDRSGKRLPQATPARPIYQTSVYENELDGAQELIEAILSKNSTYSRYFETDNL